MLLAKWKMYDRYSEIAAIVAGATTAIASASLDNNYGIGAGVLIALVGSMDYNNDVADFFQRTEQFELPPRQPDYWLNP